MKKILIVDDDDHIREELRNTLLFLAPNEFDIITAPNGKKALDILLSQNKNEHFHALITDFNMPLMNGEMLVREILNKHVPFHRIVVISGEFENEIKLSDLLISNPHIIFQLKPINLNTLFKLLK